MRLLSPLLLCSLALPALADCPPGAAEQWIADYCLFTQETDDLIAAMPCIDAASQRHFASDCARKRHFKAQLCRAVLAQGARHGSLAQCLDDPGFKGSTVEHDGSGG